MKPYHINFDKDQLGSNPPTSVLLSGEPERARYIAQNYLKNPCLLSDYRGLSTYLGYLPDGKPVLAATSGIGSPSLSIVVNELIKLGICRIIRVGTCGSIQPHVSLGTIIISQGALCRQGAALDIAPIEYPAVADPFLTVALVEAAQKLQIDFHLGITASVDTFYEGQERYDSANPRLQRWLQGITQEYRNLNILNYEMESGTLFKMSGVYRFAAASVCAAIAQRTETEELILEQKEVAVDKAIQVAIEAIQQISSR